MSPLSFLGSIEHRRASDKAKTGTVSIGAIPTHNQLLGTTPNTANFHNYSGRYRGSASVYNTRSQVGSYLIKHLGSLRKLDLVLLNQ